MIAFLNQIESCEIESTAVVRIVRPGVEVSPIGKIIINESRQYASHQWVTVAMSLEVTLNLLRITSHTAGSQQFLRVTRSQTRQRHTKHTGYRLTSWIQQ